MSNILVVVRPFAGHVKGDVISDAVTVADILAGESARYVVRVNAVAAPVPIPAPAPEPASAPAAPAASPVTGS
jgi:hypothetical protein